MTEPRSTPNAGTLTRPERSSKRVARKKPLGWLPWALLAGLAALLALIFLVINAIDDDGPDGPAGDSLGQISGSDGSGVNGEDGGDAGGGSASADPQESSSSSGGQPSAAADLAALTGASLVGGAGIAPTPASAAADTAAKRDAGTAGTVLFAEGSAELDANADRVVAQAISSLKTAGAKTVAVYGYTDVVAGAQVNDPLSQQRADGVAAALKAGLPGVQLTTEPRGQDSPVATNDTEQGRQQNRRAAIVATG